MSSKPRSSSDSKEKAARLAKEEAARAKEEAARAKEELVKAMADPAKADLLSQALLREYMHRKGFKKTLVSFDIENPRTETTINSRELMNGLLSTQFIQKRNASRAEPFPTIMEVLCSYRLRKRSLRSSRGQQSYSLVGPNGDAFDSSDEEDALKAMADAHAKAAEERRRANQEAEASYQAAVLAAQSAPADDHNSDADEDGDAGAGKTKKKKSDKKKDKKSKKEDVGADGDAKEDKKKKKNKKGDQPTAGASAEVPVPTAAVSVKAVGKGFDPLGLSKSGNSGGNSGGGFVATSLFGGSSSAALGFGAPSSSAGSRRWMPDFNVPNIGLSGGSSAPPPPTTDGGEEVEYKAPSFVAGDGFNLSTNSKKKAVPLDDWTGGKGGGGLSIGLSSSSRDNSSSPPTNASRLGFSASSPDESIPSPYANLGQVKFDSHATAKSVLATTQKHGSSSSASVGGRRITFGDERPSDPNSEVGSPLSPAPSHGGSGKVGFGFNTGSPPGASGRARRTVTIIDQ